MLTLIETTKGYNFARYKATTIRRMRERRRQAGTGPLAEGTQLCTFSALNCFAEDRPQSLPAIALPIRYSRRPLLTGQLAGFDGPAPHRAPQSATKPEQPTDSCPFPHSGWCRQMVRLRSIFYGAESVILISDRYQSFSGGIGAISRSMSDGRPIWQWRAILSMAGNERPEHSLRKAAI
jgi:hypothetical protein